MKKIKQWLQSLSFKTGVIVLLCCIPYNVHFLHVDGLKL